MNDHENVGPYGMIAYDSAQTAIDEVHARPYLSIEPPRVLVHLVFMNDDDPAGDRGANAGMPDGRAAPVGDPGSLYHGLSWQQGDLYCEKYPEFSTYLWSAPQNPGTEQVAGKTRSHMASRSPALSCAGRASTCCAGAMTPRRRFQASTR